jgi:CRP-like cAMP-binding protein
MSSDEVAFPALQPAQMAVLDTLGSRRRVVPGELLSRAGDAGYDLYVVVSGAVEITVGLGAEQRVIARPRDR